MVGPPPAASLILLVFLHILCDRLPDTHTRPAGPLVGQGAGLQPIWQCATNYWITVIWGKKIEQFGLGPIESTARRILINFAGEIMENR